MDESGREEDSGRERKDKGMSSLMEVFANVSAGEYAHPRVGPRVVRS